MVERDFEAFVVCGLSGLVVCGLFGGLSGLCCLCVLVCGLRLLLLSPWGLVVWGSRLRLSFPS